ncbi:MAG: LacI family DNA-binding transcriptional regulator, partial [Candidatus Ornithospirochaeta sp.]
MATIKDIALEADVSLGTVSNVINNRGTVKPENRVKVEEAIRKLNYHVNSTARQLRTKKSEYIGLVVPNLANPFFAEYALSVEKAAAFAGYS